MLRVSMKCVVLGIAVLSLLQSARADSLTVGATNQGKFTVDVNIHSAQGNAVGTNLTAMGGDFAGASLNAPGTFVGKLPFLYCVDLFHHINLGTGNSLVVNNTNGFYSVNPPSGSNPPAPNNLVNSTNNAKPTAGYITDFSKSGVDTLGTANVKAIAQLAALGLQTGTGDLLYAREAALQAAIWTVEYNRPTATGWSATGNSNFQLDKFVNAAHHIDTSVASANTTAFNQALAYDMKLVSGANYTALLAAPIHKNVFFTNPDVYNPGQPNAYAQAGVSYVPAPGTLIMSSILLGMVGMVRSYRRLSAVKVAA